MLQSQTLSDQQLDEGLGQTLTPSHIFEIVKRRLLYFAIPFILISAIGSLIAAAWPARYISEGKILVSSPQIPSDLVRPTVVSLANERIQVIEQRILTRDNLLAIAKKFGLSNTWRGQLSGTELVDFIRERTHIRPLELKLPNDRKQAIAFTVGFEYERPQISLGVANELLTMILNEDARSRATFAAETTKFMQQDVQRLEMQLSALDGQIAQRRLSLRSSPDTSKFDKEKELTMLRADLLLKSATYSDSHPDVKALKRKIEALENDLLGNASAGSAKAAKPPAAAQSGTTANRPVDATGIEADALLANRETTKKELENARLKLSSARLGENLERGQHSERLEVLEQPTLPTDSVSPNRPKLIALILAGALMVGGGLAVAAEFLDQSIRHSANLSSLIDSHLLVSIPYISTHAEVRRKKRNMIIAIGTLAALILVALVAIIFILPPLDLIFEKIATILLR